MVTTITVTVMISDSDNGDCGDHSWPRIQQQNDDKLDKGGGGYSRTVILGYPP